MIAPRTIKWTANRHKKKCNKCFREVSTKLNDWMAVSDHASSPNKYYFLCRECSEGIRDLLSGVSTNSNFDPCVGKIKGVERL
jgi:hypothetical protein